MTDQVDSQGVPVDNDHELNDPGSDVDAPDDLIGEHPKSGALSAVVGSKDDQASRAAAARSGMDDLRAQYAATAKSQSDAYAKQKDLIDQATQKLVNMNVGPSEREGYWRALAALGAPGSAAGAAGRVSGVMADQLQAQREAEMQKQQLIAQYGMQGAQAQIGGANSRLNQLTQQMRIQQSDINNSSNAANKPQALVNKYYSRNPSTGELEYHPEMAAADEQLAVQKAKDIATAKLAAQSSAMGLVSPEAVEYTQRTGKAPSGFSRNPVINAQLWQAVHQKNLAEGNTASDWYAQTQMNQAQAGVLKDFTSGKTSQELTSFNTAVGHINTLKPLIDELNNGNVAVFNNIGNWWNQNILGAPAPTDFKGVRSFVTGEISKAVLPGGGGEAERLELAKQASEANSGPALHSIMEKWQELLASKAAAMQNKWNIGTQGQHGDFKQFLLPATKKALGMPDEQQPPPQLPGQAVSGAPAHPNPLVNKWLQPPQQSQ